MAGEEKKLPVDVEDAFRLFDLPVTASKSEAASAYWKKREESRNELTGQGDKVELAWKWLSYHYNGGEKPKGSINIFNPRHQETPEEVANDLSFDIEAAFKILRIPRSLPQREVKKRYWALMQELETDDPFLSERAAKARKTYERAWGWVLYGFDRTQDPPKELLVSPAMKKMKYHAREALASQKNDPPAISHQIDATIRRMEDSIDLTSEDEVALKLARAFREGGLEGVLAFLEPQRPKLGLGEPPAARSTFHVPLPISTGSVASWRRPLRISFIFPGAASEIERTISHYASLWLRDATPEQRLFLARVLELKIGHLSESFPYEDHSEVNARVRDLLSNLVAPLIREAGSAKEYVALLKEWAGPLALSERPDLLRELILAPDSPAGSEEQIAMRKYGHPVQDLSDDPGFQSVIKPFVPAPGPAGGDSPACGALLAKPSFFSKLKSLLPWEKKR